VILGIKINQDWDRSLKQRQIEDEGINGRRATLSQGFVEFVLNCVP